MGSRPARATAAWTSLLIDSGWSGCPVGRLALARIHRLARVMEAGYPWKVPSDLGRWRLRDQPQTRVGGHLLDAIFSQPRRDRRDLR